MSSRLRMAAVLVGLLGGLAWADTIVVPGDHDTLQAAVDAAGDGDEIQIRGGTYSEFVTVGTKTNLTIVAKKRATIAPPDDGSPALDVQESNGIVIRGLRIEGGAQGIRVENSQNVRIEKCQLKATADDGIEVRVCTNVTLESCKVEDADDEGIKFGDIDGAGVAGGGISKCSVRGADGRGFEINATDVVISKCSSDNTDDDSFDVRAESVDVTLEKCRALRSGDEAFKLTGLRTKAIKCFANIAEEEGFDVEGDGCEVEKCKANRCRRGIEFDGVSSGLATKCKLFKSLQDGVYIHNISTNVSVEMCFSKQSAENGFHLGPASTGNTLTRNEATKNGDSDLRDENGEGANTYTDNKFKTVDIFEP